MTTISRRRVIPALVLLLALAACADPVVDDGAAPWRVGAIVDGWRVIDLTRQPEFVRLRLEQGTRTTGVELGARDAEPSEWATLQHRVQPAPAEDPPEALLVAVRDDLRRWEAGPNGRSLLRRADPIPSRTDAGASRALAALAGAWALALAATLALLWRRDPRTRGPLTLVALAVGATALAGALWPATRVPVAWLTVMHEGLGRWHIEQLYARAVHAGPLADWLARLAAGGASPGLRDVAWSNTLLAGVNLAAGAASAWLVTGRRLAAPLFAAALLLCPPFVLAAGSELAAQPAATLALGAAASLALLARAPGRREGLLACAGLALGTALAGLLRAELLLPGGAALLGAAVRVAVDDDRLAGMTARWRRRLAPVAVRAALLGALVAVGFIVSIVNGSHLGKLEWALAGLNPIDPSLLAVPAALALALPLGGGLVVLVALGRAVLTPGAPWLVPLALLVLVKTAVAASVDNPYVLTRLLAYVAPAALLMSLTAWPALISAGARLVARTGRPRTTTVGLLVLGLVPGAWCGLPAFSPWSATLAADGAPAVSLDRDTQAEVRTLVTWTEAHPDCVVIARVVAADRAVSPPLPWQWKAFGRPLAEPVDWPWSPDDVPARVAARVAPRATCRLLYCGLDTSLVLADGCPEAHGLTPVEAWTFASRPYVRKQLFGEHRPDVRLGLFRLPVP